MKKYHLADLFTLLEVILAIALFIMAIIDASAEAALWTFVAGELCDAVDGPCARKWHYPDDGKYRWWRKHNSEIDQISDILLAVNCGIYLIWRISILWGILLLGGIGISCLIVEYKVFYYDHTTHSFQRRPGYQNAEQLILFRRRFYVVAGVGGAIALLLWNTSWSTWTKLALSIIGVANGIMLGIAKSNRWNEDKTPL